MKPGFNKMVEESPEIQITLDQEDPNASRSEIVVRSDLKLRNLVRKSDVSDRIIDLQYKPNLLLESEPQDSPVSLGNNPEFDNKIIDERDDRSEIGNTDQLHEEAPSDTFEAKLPIVNYFVPLDMTISCIIENFKETCKQQKFKIIEYEASNVTAVYKAPFSIKKILFKCIPIFGGDDDEDSVSAIRICLAIDEVKGCRKITIKGLYGNSAILKTFIKYFNRKIKNSVNKGVTNSQINLFKESERSKSSVNFEQQIQASTINKEEKKAEINPGDQDEQSNKYTYYFYHKILSSDQYTLGK